MPLSVPAALATIEAFLSAERDSFPGDSPPRVPQRPQSPRHPHAHILPAFRETWRGGPNVIAPSHGSCFVSADCAWRDRTRVAQEHIKAVRSCDCAECGAHKEASDDETCDACGFGPTECRRCESNADPVESAAVPRDRDFVRAVREARRNRARLFRSCRAQYPHGALGLRENPYGHAGEVYDGMQERLAFAAARAAAPLKRIVPYRAESLFGAVALRQSREVRCKGGCEPEVHLLGAALLDDLM